MNQFLKSNNFYIPNSYDIKNIKDNNIYFIKHENGFGSINTQRILGKDIRNISDINNYLIEEECHAPEYTVECFYYKNHLKTLTRERLDSKAGVCSKARIFYSPYFQQIIKNLVKNFNAPLYFNLQFMKNNTSQYVITDVNLRLAGGINMNNTIGWSIPLAISKIILGKNDKEILDCFPTINNEFFVIRTYQDILTKINKPTIAFDFDGTLVDSRARHSILLKEILKNFNYDIDVTDLINFKRNNKNNIEFLISKGLDKNTAEKIQKIWIKNIENIELLKTDKLYPESIKLIEKYSNKNDLILITARTNKKNLYTQLKTLNIKKYFKEIFIVEPSNQVAQNKASILIDNNVQLMIGDTKTDFIASKIANIPFEHCNNGFHDKSIIYKD